MPTPLPFSPSLFLFLLLLHPIFSQNSCPARLPLPPAVQSRIVGGHPASAHLIPYLIALQSYDPHMSSWFTYCTATLLSPQWAISAAHCNISPSHRALFLANNTLFGLGHLPTNGSFVSNIRRVIPHPNYNTRDATGPSYDIAVFQLENPTLSNVKHMSISINPLIPDEKSFVRVLGFGVQAENSPTSLERSLDQVDVPVTRNTDCQRAYSVIQSLLIDPSRHVCAGYTDGGCDSCQGDSGGPMIQYNKKNEPVLVGIVSSGVGCARPDFPGIYVRTAAFEKWLDEEIGKTGYSKSNSTVAVYQEGWSEGKIITAAVAGSLGLAILVVVVVVVVMMVRRKS